MINLCNIHQPIFRLTDYGLQIRQNYVFTGSLPVIECRSSTPTGLGTSFYSHQCDVIELVSWTDKSG